MAGTLGEPPTRSRHAFMIFVVVSCPGLPCRIVFDPVGAIKERPFLGVFSRTPTAGEMAARCLVGAISLRDNKCADHDRLVVIGALLVIPQRDSTDSTARRHFAGCRCTGKNP